MTSEDITQRILALNGALRELRETFPHEPGYTRRDELIKMMAPIAKLIADLGGAFDASGVPADKP